MGRVGWGLARLFGAFFLTFMGVGALQAFLKIYWRGSFSGVEVAWILAAVYFTFTAGLVASSLTVARLGLPLAIFLGALGYFLFAAAVAWITSYPLLLAAAVMWGISASLLWAGSASYVLDASAASSYGRSSQRLYFATRCGVVIGVLTYSLLVAAGAEGRLPWLGVTATALAAGLVVFLPRPPVHVGPARRGGLGIMLRTLASGEWAVVCLFLFLGAWISGIFLYLFVTYVADELGRGSVVLVTLPFYLAAASANLWTGSLSDRIGRRWVYAIGFAGGAVGLLALAAVGSLGLAAAGPATKWLARVMVVVGSALAGQELATVETLGMSWVGDNTTRGDRTRAYGVTFASMDLGIATSVLAAAYLSEYLTPVPALLVFACVSLGCVGLSFVVQSAAGRPARTDGGEA